MDMKNYILVTPCKNEEESLPELAESVMNQDILPVLWVVVNDGSTDNTATILDELCSKNEWIKSVTLGEKPRDLGVHVSHVYRTGFDFAINYCRDNNLEYDYIASVDADIILDKNYYSCLLKKFESTPRLGICSGHIGNIVGKEVIWANYNENLPSGGARLWSKECFEETGGYLLTCSPDSVSNVKAKLKGWDTKYISKPTAISTRPYSSAQGQWKGYRRLGSNNYFIGYTPIHICLKGVKLLYSKNGYFKTGVGLAYMYGYFHDLLSRKARIYDKEILEYYGNNRLKEILWSMIQFPRKSK